MPLCEGRPAGLVLAAGGGRRFGRPKALVEFHGEPLVRRAVRLVRQGGCSPAVVVVGADGARVAARLDDPAAEIIQHDRWRTGMGGSLRAGLTALRSTTAPAAIVVLVDQPLVAPEAVRRLVDAWRRGALIAVATYEGHPRNPVLFDARTWDAVDRWAVGDEGARGLLRARSEWVENIACDDVASPRDIDTESDLRDLTSAPDPNPVGVEDAQASKEQQWN